MATVIDSLVVTLGLDSSKFSSGKAKVKTDLTDLKKTTKETGDGFGAVAASAVKFLAVLGGAAAIKNFIRDMTESNAALDRLSKNLGMNVSTLSEWSNAAEAAGGSAGGLQGTLDMLSQSQTELMLTGQSSLIPYLSTLGVAIADVNGKARPTTEILLDLSERFSHMDRTTANNMGRMMGLDQGTLNLLLKGRAAVEAMLEQQKRIGPVTKEQAEAASQLSQAYTEAGQALSAAGRDLLVTITPALVALFKATRNLFEWMRDNKTFVITFFSVVGTLLAVAYTPALIAAAAATWAFLAPILAIVAPILAVAAAIAALVDDYETWKGGGQSLIDWGAWGPPLEKAKAAIEALTGAMKDAWEWATKLNAVSKWSAEHQSDKVGHALTSVAAMMGSEDAQRTLDIMAKPEAPLILKKRAAQATSVPIAPVAGTSTGLAGTAFGALVAKGEGDYTSVNLGKAGGYKASKRDLSNMTVAEVMKAQANQEFNAAGRYQIIKGTLKDAVKSLGLTGNEKFDRATQDRIFQDYLVKVKRKPLYDYLTGKSNNINAAMKASSQEWASFVNPETGRGTYDQPGVNHANITTAQQIKALQASRAQMMGGAAPASAGATVTNNIGEVKVYTNATDAHGVAQGLGKAMDNSFVSQANTGMR